MKRFVGVLLAGAILGTMPAVAQAAPPEGVTGMALDGRAEISWQPVAGATAYNVYRGTTAASVNTPVSLTGVPPPPLSAPASFTDNTAANNTTYFYGVRAVVGGVESGNSRLVQVTPQGRVCSGGNVITQENCFPGQFSWKVPSDSTGVMGFATKQSIDRGESIDFKIKADTPTVSIEIFRNGFYGGAGARLYTQMDNVPVASQPACNTNASTGLYDCANWSVTQTVTTTANWPSGVYLARITRPDTFKASHILFVVRDDERDADVLFGLPFTTYQAYNSYGGKSLYEHNSTGADTVAGDAARGEGLVRPALPEPVRGGDPRLVHPHRLRHGQVDGERRVRHLVRLRGRLRDGRRAYTRPPGLHIGRPRRVPVGRHARRGGDRARRRHGPPLHRCQRDVLEGPLRVQPGLERPEPRARLLQDEPERRTGPEWHPHRHVA